jgi:aerobic C4-dicarboxylate transport protein
MRRIPLYVQVLIAIAAGAIVGLMNPSLAIQLKPLADAFIRLIKALVAPLVFATIVLGIAGAGDLKRVGRVGWRALVYFEALSTVALLLGLAVGNWFEPGSGIDAGIRAKTPDPTVEKYAADAKRLEIGQFLLNALPDSLVGSLTSGDLLPVLVSALLVGIAAAQAGERAGLFVAMVRSVADVLFGVVEWVMRLAPIGAFGAIAFTVGKFGLETLLSLAKLMGCVYLACGLFIFVALGVTVRLAGLRLLPLLRYLREELLLVVSTSSSESALPAMMRRLERMGCPKTVVGLVLPAGYSFNLDGTSIYLSMAALFIAQATHTPFGFGRQAALLGLLLLTSKGAAAVSGGGFVTLAATLSATGALPVGGLGLLLGVDRFMSEARALTNLVGNAVAVIVVSRWEGRLDLATARRELGISNGPGLDN